MMLSLQGHGLGQNEGEVVNVPFPICESDDDECKLVYNYQFLSRCAYRFITPLRQSGVLTILSHLYAMQVFSTMFWKGKRWAKLLVVGERTESLRDVVEIDLCTGERKM